MDQPGSTFERIIKEDRIARESKVWHGSLIEYLEILKKDPTIHAPGTCACLRRHPALRIGEIADTGDGAAKRLYKDEPVKVYNFFKEEFFGIEKTISQIVVTSTPPR